MTEIVLSGTAQGRYPTITVNGTLKLGGTLKVSVAPGYTIEGGKTWHVASGTGVRQGEFDAVDFSASPKLRLRYTEDGYNVHTCIATFLLIK